MTKGQEGIPAFEGKARRELEEELALLRQFVADLGERLGVSHSDRGVPALVMAGAIDLIRSVESGDRRDRRQLVRDILLAYLNGTPPSQWGDPLEAVKRARQIAELFESVP